MMQGWRRQAFAATHRSLPSRLCILGSIDELSDFRALLVQVGQVLLTQFLVRLELFLGFVLFAGMYVGLAKPIVRVGQVKIYFQRTLILGNRIWVLVFSGIASGYLC